MAPLGSGGCLVTPRRHPLQRDSGGRLRLGWGLESTFAGSADPASVRSQIQKSSAAQPYEGRSVPVVVLGTSGLRTLESSGWWGFWRYCTAFVRVTKSFNALRASESFPLASRSGSSVPRKALICSLRSSNASDVTKLAASASEGFRAASPAAAAPVRSANRAIAPRLHSGRLPPAPVTPAPAPERAARKLAKKVWRPAFLNARSA
jgi:hypothetical protein